MKSTLVSLLISALALPAGAITPAGDPTVAALVPKHRCNWKTIDEAVKPAASDIGKVKTLIGAAAIEGSAGEERIKLPTSGDNRGDAAGNPLCHHDVWVLVERYKSQDGKPFHSSKKGFEAVKEQLRVLKAIGDGFVDVDKAVEKAVQEAKQVLRLGHSLKITAVDFDKPKSKIETRGPAALALKTEEVAEYTSNLAVDFTKEKGTPGDEGVKYRLAIVAEAQPDDKAQTYVGVRVEELHTALNALAAAVKKFAETVSSDLVSKLGDSGAEIKLEKNKLLVSDLRKRIDNLAKSNKQWSTDTPTGETGAFGHFDLKTRDRLSVYGNQVAALVDATAKVYLGRTSGGGPADPAAPVKEPKPAVDGAATSGKIDKFRNAFQTKALEDINAGIGTMDISEPEKAALREKYKSAKAQVIGNKVYLVDGAGNIIEFTDEKKGLKLAEAPIPADLSDANAESEAAKAAAPVAALIREGELAKAKAKAAATALTSPAAPQGLSLYESLAAGGASGLKSETSCTGPDKLTAEDYKNKLGREAREKSAKRTAERIKVEKAFDDAVAAAEADFQKCAVFPKGDPRGAEGTPIMSAKLMSEADKKSHPTVVKCSAARDRAVADAQGVFARDMARADVGTEGMQAQDDAASEKKAEAGAGLALKVHIINRVGALRTDWAKSPDNAKPYAKGYENEITSTRIRSYFDATWPKGSASDSVAIADAMNPTEAELKSLERPAKYEESVKHCLGSVRIGANDDVEKCVGGLFGRYIDGLAAAAAGGGPAPTPTGGDEGDFKAKVRKCMDEGGKWVGGKCQK